MLYSILFIDLLYLQYLVDIIMDKNVLFNPINRFIFIHSSFYEQTLGCANMIQSAIYIVIIKYIYIFFLSSFFESVVLQTYSSSSSSLFNVTFLLCFRPFTPLSPYTRLFSLYKGRCVNKYLLMRAQVKTCVLAFTLLSTYTYT